MKVFNKKEKNNLYHERSYASSVRGNSWIYCSECTPH
mgnify:CR=1 FL=1